MGAKQTKEGSTSRSTPSTPKKSPKSQSKQKESKSPKTPKDSKTKSQQKTPLLPVIQEPKPTFNSIDKKLILSQATISDAELKNKFEIFLAFSNNSPKLNEEDFCRLCVSLKNEIPDHYYKILSQIFKSIDSDHDGFIRFEEFIISYHHIHRGTLRRKLEYTYKLYDPEDTGKLDAAKIERFVTVMLKLLNAESQYNASEVAAGCMKLLDPSGKGEVSRGTYFCDLVLI